MAACGMMFVLAMTGGSALSLNTLPKLQVLAKKDATLLGRFSNVKENRFD
jgi:ABC-type nickel/cobalt efflux system permease component RcnA